uniref:Uncharacterized protein n=1 Tax=Panagrolaimus sp. ES5 TaxID=591445 RepID=A0AC34FD83_9BILA
MFVRLEMKIFIFSIIFLNVLPNISGLNFNINENEELCNSQMKDLSICKLRTLLDQAVREMNEIMLSYSELNGFYSKLNEHASSVSPSVNSGKEKRKSAFVRFGKRSNEAASNDHQQQNPTRWDFNTGKSIIIKIFFIA